MNVQLFSFCLFLLWFGVTLVVFVFGPLFYPKMFHDSSRLSFLGFGAAMLAIWNFVKWWSIRQRFKHYEFRKELEEAYRRRTNPTSETDEKPILNPDFQFEESRTKLPPPPPPNGTSH